MSRRKRHRKRSSPTRRDLPLAELVAIVERAKSGALSETDYTTLKTAVDTLAFLTQELAAKGTTIERLRKMLFGPSSEKTSRVVGANTADGEHDAAAGSAGDSEKAAAGSERPKPAGHGRNGAAAYLGANKIKVPHATLSGGVGCPGCATGKVYPLPPSVLLRIQGMAPLAATVWECDRLRCNLCGEIFTAEAPDGVGDEKYDETAASMIGLLKYGAGVPFNRIEKLEAALGVPLPATTQWEIVERAARQLEPAYTELKNQAAQGQVLHNDDTTMKILELGSTRDQDATGDEDAAGDERTGIFTTAIVAKCQEHRVALFVTGRRHAGENLADVLARRAAELAAPIQMCDALSRNLPAELQTILANCLSHARRRFVDVVNDFPTEVRHVLEALGDVYKNDRHARLQELSPDERLAFHQANSGPRMQNLETWLRAQVDERKVEPNSGLGEAIGYMLKHWAKLTLFLRVPGAPLDNNICERALKKAILHRKNALFYKTLNGAHVGDVFMSLIHSVELNRENAFEYLVALQRQHEEVAADPAAWMPWNFRETLAHLVNGRDPPG
jgi:transposase